MKKFFLLLCAAVMAGGVSHAYEFHKFPGVMFHSMSPDGKWLVSNQDGSLIIYHVTDSATYSYEAGQTGDPYYSVGMNNLSINNAGIVVGAMNNHEPAYWQNNEWTKLPMRGEANKGTYSLANAITPDSKYICGSIATGDFGSDVSRTIYFPAIWTLGADGKYGEYELLPHPDKDFTGRDPQYITAVAISDDGNTVAGQIVSYDGFACYPIVYTKDAKGQWSYKIYGLDRLTTGEATYPAYPSYQPKQPKAADFMDDEAKQKYQDALDEYNDLVEQYNQGLIKDWPKYPKQDDYVSDKDGYAAAKARYEKEYTAYEDSVNTFNAVYEENYNNTTYIYNTIGLSANGRYLAQTYQRLDPNSDPLEGPSTLNSPVLIDLKDGGKSVMGKRTDVITSTVTNDGDVAVSSPAIDYTRNGFIWPNGSEETVPLDEWLGERCDTAQAWLKDNMVYGVYTQFDDEGNPKDVKDSLIAGTIICNPEGTVFVGYAFDMWTMDDTNVGFTSYMIDITDPKNPSTGIANVGDSRRSALNVSAANGRINVSGDVAGVEVYDMAGRRIADTNDAAVSNGLYVVKAKAADGQVLTRKVVVK